MLLGAMAGGKLVEDTVTGNPLTFITDKAKPLKSLLVPFTPQQEGSGDPSPSNIRSILPWDGLTVYGGGKNLLNPAYFAESSDFYSVENGVITAKKSDYRAWSSVPKMLLHAGTYTISKSTSEGIMMVRSSINDYASSIVYAEGVASGKFTLNQDAYIAIKPSESMSYPATFTIQLEVGSSATTYEEYKPITETAIPFASPVYGGTLDVVSGVLTVEWVEISFNGTESANWGITKYETLNRFSWNKLNLLYPAKNNGQSASNYLKRSTAGTSTWTHFVGSTGNIIVYIPKEIDTREAWKTYLAENNLQIVYELAEPYTATLSPEQITALIGQNTMWSDADGSMTAVYLKKG